MRSFTEPDLFDNNLSDQSALEIRVMIRVRLRVATTQKDESEKGSQWHVFSHPASTTIIFIHKNSRNTKEREKIH